MLIKKLKRALNIISEYGFSDKALIGIDLIPYLQRQRRGFTVSEDPQVHERILNYQSRLLDHLLNRNVLIRMTNSTLYGNDYDITEYMIDLRNSIFKSDLNTNVSSMIQYLQISYVLRLVDIIDSKSKYDLISRSKAHYNLVWLKDNLKNKRGNSSTQQHREYIINIIHKGSRVIIFI